MVSPFREPRETYHVDVANRKHQYWHWWLDSGQAAVAVAVAVAVADVAAAVAAGERRLAA